MLAIKWAKETGPRGYDAQYVGAGGVPRHEADLPFSTYGPNPLRACDDGRATPAAHASAPAAPAAPVPTADASLPPGWSKVPSPAHGEGVYYYWNHQTNEFSWHA